MSQKQLFKKTIILIGNSIRWIIFWESVDFPPQIVEYKVSGVFNYW